MSFNIVLVEPEIPQNTGNIARTCAATGAKLHLVRPMGFEITDKHLKRAGLDYWHLLDVKYYDDINHFFKENAGGNFYYSTTKAVNKHTDVSYSDGDYLVFGKETKGLDEALLHDNKEKCIRIPMIDEARSLNLSNAVAIVLYEAMRQVDFQTLKTHGALTKYTWD